MSRAETKNHFTLSQYKKEMKEIYTTSVFRETLDESPMVYKPMEAIVGKIGETVDVTVTDFHDLLFRHALKDKKTCGPFLGEVSAGLSLAIALVCGLILLTLVIEADVF